MVRIVRRALTIASSATVFRFLERLAVNLVTPLLHPVITKVDSSDTAKVLEDLLKLHFILVCSCVLNEVAELPAVVLVCLAVSCQHICDMLPFPLFLWY